MNDEGMKKPEYDRIQIMSVNGYMQKYAVDGIGKGADRWQVKRNMLDEFRREILNMAVFKVGPEVFSNEYEGSEEDRKKLTNIIDNANKKWKNLCREFEKYRETSGLLKETDLQDYLEDRMNLTDEGEEDTEDEDERISTAHLATDEELQAMEDLKEDVIHDDIQEEEEETEDDGLQGTDPEG